MFSQAETAMAALRSDYSIQGGMKDMPVAIVSDGMTLWSRGSVV